MSILKFKKPDGTWESIAAIKGEPGKDGAIQYQAGEGIKIEGNVISSENSGSSNMGVVHIVTSQNLNSDENFAPTLRTDLNNALTDYFANNNNENPVLIIKGTSNSETHVFVPTSASSFISIAGNLSAGYIERRISCTFQYIDGVKNVKSVNYYFKRRNILFKDNTDSFTPTSDYHPATKKYVDNSIANIDVSGPKYVYEFDLKREGRPLNTTIILNDDEKERLRLLLNQILADGTVNTHIILLHNSLWDGRLIYLTPFYNSHLDDITASDFYQYLKYNGVFIDNATANDFGYEQFQLEVNYKSSTGESIDSMSTCKINWDYGYIIGTNNKYAFTPTSDYHPATKKYVDDSIAAIDIPEGGGADLTGYATEEYVDNAIANVPIKQIPKVINCTFSDDPTNEYTTQKELYLTNSAKTEITNLINEDMSNPPPIVLRSYNWYAYHLIPLYPEGGGSQNSVFKYSGMYAISPTKINFYHLSINGGIQSGVFVSSTWYLKVKTLDTSGYATKEDVNNAITAAITTTLGGDY